MSEACNPPETWWAVWGKAPPRAVQVEKKTDLSVWYRSEYSGPEARRQPIRSGYVNHFPDKDSAAKFCRERIQAITEEARALTEKAEKMARDLIAWEKKEAADA